MGFSATQSRAQIGEKERPADKQLRSRGIDGCVCVCVCKGDTTERLSDCTGSLCKPERRTDSMMQAEEGHTHTHRLEAGGAATRRRGTVRVSQGAGLFVSVMGCVTENDRARLRTRAVWGMPQGPRERVRREGRRWAFSQSAAHRTGHPS